ncbi:MAG: hypothetical protein KGY45_03270 [Hadesarchaea archaeon]|nr:hypothetical protein [Hadesarchaea archaeon]
MSNEKGAVIWRILFSVIMAILLAGALFAYIYSQRSYGVGSQAQSLANELSRTSFSALYRESPTYNLPKDVGGSYYEVEIDSETDSIIIKAEGGTYHSAVGVNLENIGKPPEPGGTLYSLGGKGKVLVSSNPITPENQEIKENIDSPPSFYYFAKENPREAVAIAAAYFRAIEIFPDKKLGVQEYKKENSNSFLIRISSSDENIGNMRVIGRENSQVVGFVESSWIVDNVSVVPDNFSGVECPSIENSISKDWLYSPDQIVRLLKKRSWREPGENEPVSIPNDVEPIPATVKTNVSTYPSYRFEFSSSDTGYVLHFGLMPWKADEEQSGFVFESEPDLEAIV